MSGTPTTWLRSRSNEFLKHMKEAAHDLIELNNKERFYLKRRLDLINRILKERGDFEPTSRKRKYFPR